MNRFLFVLTFCIMALTFVSCQDVVLTNGNAQPTIDLNGKDCFDFGSLLRGSTSSTRKLLVQNKNNGTLALESIILRGGVESPFKINVDGMAGTSFTRPELLHIAKGDSLFVLLEVSAPLKQTERECALEDYLDISCNGQLTSIRLKALSLDVEQLRDYSLTEDLRWDANGCDKQIFGTLTIPEGLTLTIADSTTLFMHDQSRIEVFGRLIIDGSPEHPVTMIGDRTDKMFDNLYYRDMGGQWGGVNFHPGSEGSRLDHALLKGMTQGVRLHQSVARQQGLDREFLPDDHQQLVVRNSTLMNADSALIYAVNSNMIVENSLLMNSGGPLLELHGGVYDVTHCTLANYAFWTPIRGADLFLANYAEEKDKPIENCPLYRCNLTNTLVYGRSERDPNVDLKYRPYLTADGVATDSIFTYRFDHCLLHASGGSDDEDFIQTLWTDDPLYLLVDMPNYICDPHLQPESPARGKGTTRTLEKLPLDLDGKQRAEIPSIGCYE